MTAWRLIDDATGTVLDSGSDPIDLFDADEAGEDDELFAAIIAAYEEQRVPVGGGASPLLWIERVTED